MPTKLEPKFVERVWGKQDLAPLYPPQPKPTGEVWFDNGSLLIKFLFTIENLSVQVHPEDEYAGTHHGGSAGKTEMWHILAAESGSKIALGFNQHYDTGAVRAAAESGAIMEMLRWIEAKPDETYFVPAGTVHALGGGFIVCEIQQTSDITYRMFDYGRGRELHLDHSMNVARLEPYVAPPTTTGIQLAACPYFVTEKLTWRGQVAFKPVPGARDEAIIALSGSGEVNGRPFAAGEVWRVDDEPLSVTGNSAVVLHTYVPR